MFSNVIQFNREKVISTVIAVLMLALAASPALARFNEEDTPDQSLRPCHVILDARGTQTVYCNQAPLRYPRRIAEQPLVRPAIAKAEHVFIFNSDSTELAAQPGSNQ